MMTELPELKINNNLKADSNYNFKLFGAYEDSGISYKEERQMYKYLIELLSKTYPEVPNHYIRKLVSLYGKNASNILSTGKIIASSSGLLSNFGDNSNVLIDINEYSTPRTISSSKGNYIFKANTIRKTSANRMFWFSGSNKSISIQVENLFLDHTLPVNSYDAGCFNFEAALGHTLNSNINIDVTNIVQNSYVGAISDIGCGSGNSIYDSNFNLKIDNLYQYSTYTSYSIFPINN